MMVFLAADNISLLMMSGFLQASLMTFVIWMTISCGYKDEDFICIFFARLLSKLPFFFDIQVRCLFLPLTGVA